MKCLRILILTGLVACIVPRAVGQTRVDLRTQGRDVDFSAASFTKPVKTGTTLPSSCEVGEMYLLLGAPEGRNLYACMSTSTWSLQASGDSQSAASVASQLGDFQVVRTSPTTLTINGRCSGISPCIYRFGGVASTVTSPAEASLDAQGGTGTAYFYLSQSGELTVGYTAGLMVNCTPGCMPQASVSGFPSDSIPLFLWRASSDGQWDASGTDARAFLGREALLTGLGLLQTTSSSAGAMVLEIDPTVVATQTSAPASATATCSRGQLGVDADYLYVCVGADTWKRVSLSAW